MITKSRFPVQQMQFRLAPSKRRLGLFALMLAVGGGCSRHDSPATPTDPLTEMVQACRSTMTSSAKFITLERRGDHIFMLVRTASDAFKPLYVSQGTVGADVRDHRGQPDVRDHRGQPDVRDHRGQPDPRQAGPGGRPQENVQVGGRPQENVQVGGAAPGSPFRWSRLGRLDDQEIDENCTAYEDPDIRSGKVCYIVTQSGQRQLPPTSDKGDVGCIDLP